MKPSKFSHCTAISFPKINIVNANNKYIVVKTIQTSDLRKYSKKFSGECKSDNIKLQDIATTPYYL